MYARAAGRNPAAAPIPAPPDGAAQPGFADLARSTMVHSLLARSPLARSTEYLDSRSLYFAAVDASQRRTRVRVHRISDSALRLHARRRSRGEYAPHDAQHTVTSSPRTQGNNVVEDVPVNHQGLVDAWIHNATEALLGEPSIDPRRPSPVADHQVVSADADLEEQGTQEVLVVEGMVEATITPPLVVVLRGPSLTSCLIKVASVHSRNPPLRVCHEFRCVCCKRRGKLYLDEFRKL